MQAGKVKARPPVEKSALPKIYVKKAEQRTARQRQRNVPEPPAGADPSILRKIRAPVRLFKSHPGFPIRVAVMLFDKGRHRGKSIVIHLRPQPPGLAADDDMLVDFH